MGTTISIIVPVYNAEKTISKCIESILNNAYSDFEIILVDDGSSDNSMKILESYREKYPGKIRIFNQENQGVAKTRNKGIGYADSKYIMFVDHDDSVASDYLEKFVTEIEKKNLDVVIGGYRRTADEKTLYEMRLKDVLWSRYMIMAPWSKIYKRDFLLANKIEFLDNNIGEDVYFNLQVINLTDKISLLDYCGYNWFYNERSVSNTSQKALKSDIHVMFLLNSSYDKLKAIGVADRSEVEFYFTRYIIWYLLFIGRNSNYKQIVAELARTFLWLKEHFPEFQKNRNISLLRPEGETFKNRIAVYFFMMIYRLNLIPFFFRIYSRG